MEYKIIALDIDGTVTNSEKQITQRTQDAILQVQKAGKTVVLASGRPDHGIMPVAEELSLEKYHGYILAFNGGRITNCTTGETVYQQTLPSKIICALYEDAKNYGIGINTYKADRMIAGSGYNEYMELESKINKMPIEQVEDFPEYIDFDIYKCLMSGNPDYLEGVEKKLQEKYGQVLNIFRSEPFFLEIMPKYVDKEHSLRKLLEYLCLKQEELICVGDGYNDCSMIEYAGLGAAMANAQDVVKQVADYITLSNDEDGVAKVIEKFML